MFLVKNKDILDTKYTWQNKTFVFKPRIIYKVPEEFYKKYKSLLIHVPNPPPKAKISPLKKEPERVEKPILIIGNGPSVKLLEDYGFHNLPGYLHCFGMNSAYRYFELLHWWPKYYASFDYKVSKHHMDDFVNILKNSKIPIEKFFTYQSLVPKEHQHLEKFNLRGPDPVIRNLSSQYITTGTTAAKIAIEMGYNKLILIGVDCNYVDEIDGCKRIKYTDGRGARDYVMAKTPKENPNYFFNDYQREGDEYRWPHKEWHIKCWETLAEQIKDTDIEIVNCSNISEVKCFPVSTLEKEFGKKNKKLITFCMALKNRSSHAIKSIKSLVDKKFVDLDLFDFIVVEDESKDMLKLGRFKYKDYIKHQIINTGDSWNKSKLLNHAFKQVETPYIMTWDADFVASERFLGDILSMVYKGVAKDKTYSFDKYYLALCCTETDRMERKQIGRVFKKFDYYGAGYLFRTDHCRTIHGYDEEFIDYGWEEYDFNYRLKMQFQIQERRVWDRHLLYHLSHDETMSGSKENYCNNGDKLKYHKSNGICIVNKADKEWDLLDEID
jgi:hypothetical protein